jgi:hypothetical protein
MQIINMRSSVYKIYGTDKQRIITLIDVREAQRDCNVMDVKIEGSIIAQAPLYHPTFPSGGGVGGSTIRREKQECLRQSDCLVMFRKKLKGAHTGAVLLVSTREKQILQPLT